MIEVLACTWATSYAVIAVVALVRARRRTVPADASPAPLRHALLVRPCRGGESDLARRLKEAGGCRHVVLAIGSADDTARPALEQAQAALMARGLTAAVVVTRARGPNHKADQIARCLADPTARSAQFVVVADSDVDLEGEDLSALLAPLAAPGSTVGACWAPPIERGAVLTRGDSIARAVLGASLHAFPLLAGIDGRTLVGKLFAIRRDVLDAIGGFAPLRHCLGEDVELARRLVQAGHTIAVSGQPAITRTSGRTTDAVLARYTRWLQVTRAQRPLLVVSYPLLIAATPLAVIVSLAGALEHMPGLYLAGALVLAVRLLVACAARRATGLATAPSRAAVDCVVADVTLLVALVRALVTRHVSWRGSTLMLGPGGVLMPGRNGMAPVEKDDAAADSGEHRRLVMQQRLAATRHSAHEAPVTTKSYSRIHEARRRRSGRANDELATEHADGGSSERPDERRPRRISGIHKRARGAGSRDARHAQPDDDRLEPTGIKRSFEPGTELPPESPRRSGESGDDQA